MVEPGKPVLANATLVTVDGKVHSVHEGFRNAAELGLAPDTELIDLSSQYVLPGFMDLHVHITASGLSGRPSGLRMRQDDAFFAPTGSTNPLSTLISGSPKIRLPGSPKHSTF